MDELFDLYLRASRGIQESRWRQARRHRRQPVVGDEQLLEGSLDIQAQQLFRLQLNWPELVERLRDADTVLGLFLTASQPVALCGGRLTLAFKYESDCVEMKTAARLWRLVNVIAGMMGPNPDGSLKVEKIECCLMADVEK